MVFFTPLKLLLGEFTPFLFVFALLASYFARVCRWSVTQCCSLYLILCPAFAIADSLNKPLLDFSLEELGQLTVSSVGRKEESVSRVTASTYVITHDAIRRSGATTIPEVLRLAPNLIVAQVDANRYAISARGFNGTVSNKLQVLIDGRIAYTPLFSGVFWDSQDVLLQDIDRIEVISGPNAAMWGANAVNGLINIISRNSSKTEGRFIEVATGSEESSFSARQGGRIGSSHYRVYAKGHTFDDWERADGTSTDDGWDILQTGFRVDRGENDETLQFQGDYYRGSLDAPDSIEFSGGNLLASWMKQLSGGDRVSLRAIYDHVEREHFMIFQERLDTFNAELSYALSPRGGHNLQLGFDYRYSRERVQNSAGLAFLPAKKDLDWVSVFAQDEYHFNDNLWLTVNARIEHNDYTGTEFMPAVRIGYVPAEDRLLWAAISRAVRTPSRIDREYHIPGTAPFMLDGGPNFRSETATSYEAGVRSLLQGPLSWSASVYYTAYDHLRTLEPTDLGSLQIDNGLKGTASGIELRAAYQAAEHWRLTVGLSWYEQDLSLKSWSRDPNNGKAEGNDPTYQWVLVSNYALSATATLDVTVRHMDGLPDPQVPEYTVFDMRVGWFVTPNFELSLLGRNLGDASHPESGNTVTRAEVPQSLSLAARWEF